MTPANKALASVLLLVCFSYIGVALPYPILAPIFLESTRAGFTDVFGLSPEMLLGLVLASYPLGMFIGGHFLGALADFYGRKPVIQSTLIGVVGSYALSAYAIQSEDFVLLLISRLSAGLFEGNIAIARSVAADLAPEIPKTTSFSYIHAAVYIGYLIGPIIGAALIYVAPSAPFYFASGLGLLSFIFIHFMFEESHKPVRTKAKQNKFNSWVIFNQPGMLNICIINVFSALAFSTFYQFYPLYLVKIYNFGSDGIAVLTVALTFSLIFASLVAVKFTKKHFSLASNIIGSLGCYCALAVVMMLVSSEYVFYVLFSLLGIFIVTTGTHMSVFVSDNTPAEDQGKLMGILSSLSAFATVSSILLGSYLATYSAYYPMIASVVVAALSLTLFVKLHISSKKSALATKVSPISEI